MSDPKRLKEVYRHIARIKEGSYPEVIGKDGQYRIVERPWPVVAEESKIAILQDAVDWSEVSNRDRAMILLAEIDVGKISDAQRNSLIDMAVVRGAPELAGVKGDDRPLTPTESKALGAEMQTDYAAAMLRDRGEDFESLLRSSAARMAAKPKEKERER